VELDYTTLFISRFIIFDMLFNYFI
jgi:hypothetical protein